TLETLGRWTGLKPEVIRELRFLPRWDPNLAVDVDNLLDQQRVHIAAGATTYADPLPASRLVDTSLADYALQQLGRRQPPSARAAGVVREYGKPLCVGRCPRGVAPSEDSMAAGAPSDELRAGPPGEEAPETPEFLDEHLGYAEVVDNGLGTAESELLYGVQDALDRYEPIRASGSRIQIRWREGSVVLTGRVRSLPIKALTELLARSASAGRPVVSELI